MKYTIPILLILGLLLAIPVSASNITITAEPLGGTLNIGASHVTDYTVDVSQLQRNAIQRISIDIPTDTTLDYTIWYGNGTELSGHMIYESATDTGMCGTLLGGLVNTWCQFSEVSIGTSTANHYYVGVEEIGRIDIVGYGRNEDTNERLFLIYDSTAGIANVGITERYIDALTLGYLKGDALAYTPVPAGVIYKFQITSSKPVTGIAYYTNTRENVDKASKTSLLDVIAEWSNFLIQIKDFIFEVFWFFYGLIQFIWDNLYLVIALWLAGTGAVSFNKTRDVGTATKNWFGYQQKLLDFILNLITRTVGLITSILK